MADAIRPIGVSKVTFYRSRQEFGGLKTEQVKRLKDLEFENSRLRKAVSDLTLDKLILTEAAKGNFRARRVVAPASSIFVRTCLSPSAAKAFQHNANLLLGRMMPPRRSADIPDRLLRAVRHALLACLIVAPQQGYDESGILSYPISLFCPTGADGLHCSL
jgi:putative transposase